MWIDAAELDADDKEFDFAVSPDEIELDVPYYRLLGWLQMSVAARSEGERIVVSGNLAGSAEVDCTRCLKPTVQRVAIDFTDVFTAPDSEEPAEHEVPIEELDGDQLADGRIDLKTVAREQILLNVPEQALCSEDCKGLCPICGADRNTEACTCEIDIIDPRWAALKDLKEKGAS